MNTDITNHLVDVIENYIEISIRRDNLTETIENSKKMYNYAKKEGDFAFYDGDYQLEVSYNVSAKQYKDRQESAEKDLDQVNRLLKHNIEEYRDTISLLNSDELKETSVVIKNKTTDIERKIEQLSERRKWASHKGDIAFLNSNIKEEEEYNKISSECYIEISKLEPRKKYYQSFATDLNVKLKNQFHK